MKELLLSGQKKMTNRVISRFRLKCKVGDRMHCFINLRTPQIEKLFDAIVIQRPLWHIDDAPETEREAKYKPVIDYQHKDNMKIRDKEIKWYEFAIIDGFEAYDQFYNYFSNHPKKKKVFLTFVFEPILFNKIFRKITEYIEV